MPAFRWTVDNDLPRCDKCPYGRRCENVPPVQIEPGVYSRKCPTRRMMEAGEDVKYIGWWREWKMFGFYWDGGQNRQPAVYMDVIRDLESEYNRVQMLNREN